MRFHTGILSLATAAALCSAVTVQAKPFKWSSQGDISTWDIHSQNNTLQNSLHAYVYESLVQYNSKTYKIEPLLATAWQAVSPTQMRFQLRKDVKFSDGTPFSADDAVFSIQRAMAKTSNFTPYIQGIDKVVKVDGLTIDVFLKGPNPVLLRQMTELRMMSKAWAEKNKSTEPKDMKSSEDNYAHRNALGTGPFTLASWQAGQRVVMQRNAQWWGSAEGNVTEVVYMPIKSPTARIAALTNGDVDLVIDPNPSDLRRLRSAAGLKVIDGLENRTIFLGMDQHRDELPGSSVKGKNPFKDVRVRKAMYQAIDMDVIDRGILRGLGKPAGTVVSPQVTGWTEAVGTRLPYNVETAKKLMAEAGYPNGFEVDFACPNNRYTYDEAICQAITMMWARIGVMTKFRSLPQAEYFPMIQRNEASIYMLGWGVPTFDALYSLQSLVRTPGQGGDGNYNVGRYSNPQMDQLIDKIKTEGDATKRTAMLTEALKLSNDTVSHIPLHDQVIPWAMKKNVELVHRADNRVDILQVKIN